MPDVETLTGVDRSDFAKVVRDVGESFQPPAFGARWDDVISTLTKVADYRFGTGAVADSNDPTVIPITNATQLAAYWNPLCGEFSKIPGQFEADGTTLKLLHLGGAGPTTINAEPQDYPDSFFGSANHVFEADNLRLQATFGVDNPVVNTYLIGQVQAPGLNVNNWNASPMVPTPIAALGITANDMALIDIGDMCTKVASGWMAVVAKDTTPGAETVTFIAIPGGSLTNNTQNYFILFTKFQFARIVSPATSASNTQNTFVLENLPSQLKTGCNVRLWVNGLDLASNNNAVVSGINTGTNQVTFDRNVAGRDLTVANGAGFVFLPGIKSGQIWLINPVGVRGRGNIQVSAQRTVYTLPPQPDVLMPVVYSRADYLRVFQAYPTFLWGNWFAIWTYNRRTDETGLGQRIVSGFRNNWAENDQLEIFNRLGLGPACLTFNNHDIRYKSYLNEGTALDPVFAWDRERNISTIASLTALNPTSGGLAVAWDGGVQNRNLGNEIMKRIYPERFLTRDGGRWLSSASSAKVATPDSGALMLGRGVTTFSTTASGLQLNRIDSVTAVDTLVTVQVTSKAYTQVGQPVTIGNAKRIGVSQDFVISGAAQSAYNGAFKAQDVSQVDTTLANEVLNGITYNVVQTVTRFTYPVLIAPSPTTATGTISVQMVFPRSQMTGQRVSTGCITLHDRLYKFTNDVLYRIDDWTPENDYQDQLGINLALGSFNGGQPSTGFFPQRNADITGANAKIHQVQVYERA